MEEKTPVTRTTSLLQGKISLLGGFRLHGDGGNVISVEFNGHTEATMVGAERFGSKVGIPHRQFDIFVTKYYFELKDITTVHHPVRRECVAQAMKADVLP